MRTAIRYVWGRCAFCPRFRYAPIPFLVDGLRLAPDEEVGEIAAAFQEGDSPKRCPLCYEHPPLQPDPPAASPHSRVWTHCLTCGRRFFACVHPPAPSCLRAHLQDHGVTECGRCVNRQAAS